MQRLPALVLVLSALWLQAAEAGVLDRVRQSGAFRIGYRVDARPYSYQDRNGNPAGYVVDLCTEVAAGLGPGVNPQYVRVPADRRFEAVRDGQVDILCDPSSVTLERREMVDFSLPTFVDGAGVISRTGRPVQTFEDLGSKRIGVLGGTTSEQTLRKAMAALNLNPTIVLAADHRAGLDLLTSDKVDAYFADRGILAAMLLEGGRPGFEVSRQYFSYEVYALALPRDDSAFRLVVDRTLARLFRSGRIEAILQKSFGKTPADDLLKALTVMNALPD